MNARINRSDHVTRLECAKLATALQVSFKYPQEKWLANAKMIYAFVTSEEDETFLSDRNE